MTVLSSGQLFLFCSAVLACSTITSAGINANIPVAASTNIPGAHKTQYTVNPTGDIITSSYQNTIHSYDGLIPDHSKGVETSYSSLHKQEKHIENKNNKNALYAPVYAKTSSHNSPTSKTVSVIYTKSVPTPTAPSSLIYNYAPHDPLPSPAPASTIYPSPTVSLQLNNALYPTVPVPTIRAYQDVAYPKYYKQNKGLETTQIVTSSASTEADAVAPPPAAPTAASPYKRPTSSVILGTYPAQQIYNHEVPKQQKVIKIINLDHADTTVYGSHNTGHHYSPAEKVSHVNFEGFGTRWAF